MPKPEEPKTAKSKFQVRAVPKFIVSSYITLKTTSVSADYISNHSRYDKDDMIVRIAAAGVGGLVGSALSPLTDGAIDLTANFVNQKRTELVTKRQAKKAAKKDAKKDKK
jgi:hypothetical protein